MTVYFTYGSGDSQPYKGGWTEIEAPSIDMAIDIFNAVHKPIYGQAINCAGIYADKDFTERQMYRSGNFGQKCVERISYEILQGGM